MNIRTNRLLVREFQVDDWEAVFEYTSNQDVMKYIPDGVHTREEAKKFVNKNRDGHAENFPVIEAESNTLIGHMVFHKYFGNHTYEIGWVFNPSYQARGYATEAAKGVLDYGFNKLDLHRIIATCQPENTPSYRVMEKAGMRREGFFKKCIPNGDDWWDEYYYSILKEEWK
ncbi:GNAT family N-acetyltransferase [Salipaludibacillus sp. HK11]|uniref:GNAT family N-acetyltransferase n=1 Tax=Salipaludibacillus sp. HK11 TaxID=3394320 RepID=UPI0039FCBCB6